VLEDVFLFGTQTLSGVRQDLPPPSLSYSTFNDPVEAWTPHLRRFFFSIPWRLVSSFDSDKGVFGVSFSLSGVFLRRNLPACFPPPGLNSFQRRNASSTSHYSVSIHVFLFLSEFVATLVPTRVFTPDTWRAVCRCRPRTTFSRP